MSPAVPQTASSRAKADTASPLALVVDNGRSPDAPGKGRPLTWGLCLLIWAALAAAGWGVIALVLHWI
jgi:hypothetical protein